MYELKATYKFDAAHFVPDCKSKCENIHGHTWNVTFEIRGDVDVSGMVVDFSVLKEMVDELDHGCKGKIFQPQKHATRTFGDGWFVKNIINDLVPVPTAEKIAEYFYDKTVVLKNVVSCRIHVEESPGKIAIYSR